VAANAAAVAAPMPDDEPVISTVFFAAALMTAHRRPAMFAST
jgi:hypothetical protein